MAELVKLARYCAAHHVDLRVYLRLLSKENVNPKPRSEVAHIEQVSCLGLGS